MDTSAILIVSFLAIGPWALSQAGEPSAVAKPAPAPTAAAPVATAASAAAPADKIAALKEQVKANPKDMTVVMKLAEEEHRAGDDASATTLLWGQIEHLERPGILLLISAHESRKEWTNVMKAANLLISKNAKDAEALTALGRAQFMRAKKPDEAKETLRKAIEANPHYRPAYDTLAQIYEKNPYEQRLLLQDMVEAFGPRADVLTRLCQLNTNDGENEQGESYCKQAIQADDLVADNHVNMGVIALQKGDPERAKKYLKSSADRFPNSEFAQFQQANFLETQKNWVDAYKYYEVCMKADAQSERCAIGLGNTSVQLRKFDRALEVYKLACHKNGRKNVAIVRRAAAALRKDGGPSERFEDLADKCQFQ